MGDRNSKHAMSLQLAKQDWFSNHHLEVRYQPGRNTISIVQAGSTGMGGGSGGGMCKGGMGMWHGWTDERNDGWQHGRYGRLERWHDGRQYGYGRHDEHDRRLDGWQRLVVSFLITRYHCIFMLVVESVMC